MVMREVDVPIDGPRHENSSPPAPADLISDGTVRRDDGRIVRWATWGDPNGRPLVVLHGTPGSRLDRTADPGLFGRIGAHVVTYDRPGYGGSTVHPGRTVLSAAEDGLAVADELGLDTFPVFGISGGGPHALAVARSAPERVSSLGIAVGMPPAEMLDLEDMTALNREGFRRALEEGRESLEEFLSEPAASLAADPGAALDAVMADAPDADREILRRPEFRALAVESLKEAFANGPQGWYDDSWALVTFWGFELAEVEMPVRLWCGELDRNVPRRSIERMAALLDVQELETIPGGGHFGWFAHEERILRTLLEASGA